MSKSDRVWFESAVSSFDKESRSAVRIRYEIPCQYKIKVPKSHRRPHLPAPGFQTFFHDQLEGGLRFSIPEFFTRIAAYFGVPVNQFAPNSFRLMSCVFLVFKVYDIPLNPTVFNYFFYPKRGRAECFTLMLKWCQLSNRVPLLHQTLENQIFLCSPSKSDPCVRMAERPTTPTETGGLQEDFCLRNGF